MTSRLLKFAIYIFQILFFVLIISSCQIQNLFHSDTEFTDNSSLSDNDYEYKLKPNDKITISIWEHDDLSVGSLFGIYNSNQVYGKWLLLDNEGATIFPGLGSIYVGGLSIIEAVDLLSERYSRTLVKPKIILRVVNMKISVLGAVNKAATIVVDEESVSLTKIIGEVGGFDYYADKSRIKLIRKIANANVEYILDLTKMEDYELANILIHPDDVIVVPSKNSKRFDKESGRLIPFLSIISTLAVVYTVIK